MDDVLKYANRQLFRHISYEQIFGIDSDSAVVGNAA